MSLLREIRKRSRQVAPQVFLACLAVYFCYHAVQGERGILAWLRLQQELTDARLLNAELAAERSHLDHGVALLRPDNLDPDMLEERARVLLNFGHSDDVLVVLPEE
jgi:cell division protein FtsB